MVASGFAGAGVVWGGTVCLGVEMGGGKMLVQVEGKAGGPGGREGRGEGERVKGGC